MFTIMLSALILSFAATMTLSSSPLLLGAWIIIITLLMSMLTNLMTASWLGLMMLLIYIGGLLVMFAYFVALTPNLIMEGTTMIKNLLYSFPVFSVMLIILISADQKSFSFIQNQPLSYLFMEHTSMITILALILFFALVATVKMVSVFSSPLRPFN